ncbi:MAG: helix-turn-helix domain-containing protein [Blautia sp.]
MKSYLRLLVRQPGKLCRLSLLFNLLLCEIAITADFPRGWELFSSDPLVEDICRQIQSNPRSFTLPGKWQTLILSVPVRLTKLGFLKVCQKTFYAYQMKPNWRWCGILIHQPDSTLHEAANNFGFYDEFHLSKAFKKQFKMSPSQFRNLQLRAMIESLRQTAVTD